MAIKQNTSASSRLALGTAQFGTSYGIANTTGRVLRSEAEKILSKALESGIDTLDTAVNYGSTEAILGEVGVKQFNVVSKLPKLITNNLNIERWVKDQVVCSLNRLDQETLFGILLHHPQDLVGEVGKILAKSLFNLKKEGLVKKVGVSVYDLSELELAVNVLKPDLVQAPLNLVDRRLVSSGWLTYLKEMGVEVHVRSVFLQGLLLMDRHKIPEKFSPWSKLWDQWHHNLKNGGVRPLAVCLEYPLSLQGVDRVIIGVDSVKQLSEILSACDLPTTNFDSSFMCSEDPRLINPPNWSQL